MTAQNRESICFRTIILSMLLMATFTVSPARATDTSSTKALELRPLVFGIYAYIRPTEVIKKFTPVLQAIEVPKPNHVDQRNTKEPS